DFSPADRLPKQFPFRTAHAYIATKRVGSFTPNYCVSDSGRSDSEQVFTQPQKLLSSSAISGWNPLTPVVKAST
ncbi:MAG TPA: hypothetical protein V6D35_04800, partial [Candidatus Sericytochromatia bacterium]